MNYSKTQILKTEIDGIFGKLLIISAIIEYPNSFDETKDKMLLKLYNSEKIECNKNIDFNLFHKFKGHYIYNFKPIISIDSFYYIYTLNDFNNINIRHTVLEEFHRNNKKLRHHYEIYMNELRILSYIFVESRRFCSNEFNLYNNENIFNVWCSMKTSLKNIIRKLKLEEI